MVHAPRSSAHAATAYRRRDVMKSKEESKVHAFYHGEGAGAMEGCPKTFAPVYTQRCMEKPKIFAMRIARVYPLYIQKAEKKGRSKAEVDAVIRWLTGYDQRTLRKQVSKEVDFKTFFAEAPHINPNASKITGVICGYRVEEITDKLMQKIRYMDKLIDELAKGKAMEKILRE